LVWPIYAKARAIDACLDLRDAFGPKTDVMPLAWAVSDCLLKSHVLASSKKVESAEWGSRIGLIEDEGPSHTPGASQV
jgi:hypothetical protein